MTQTPTIDPAVLMADHQIGLATRHLPAAERLATSHRYRALPLAQRWRRWAYHLGRYPQGGDLLTLDALLEAVQPKPGRRWGQP